MGPSGKRLSKFLTDNRTRSGVTHQDYSNSVSGGRKVRRVALEK